MSDESAEIPEGQPVITKRFVPWLTYLYMAICIVIWSLANLSRNATWEVLEKMGGATPYDIWNGQLWGLVGNNFIHVNVLHLLFNLSWLMPFGQRVEREEGRWFLLLLTLITGVASTCVQLAWYGNTGIGMSGIIYGFFGFFYVVKRYTGRYADILPDRTTQLFIIWFFGCIAATMAGLLEVGNGGHLGGMVSGMLIGWVYIDRRSWRYAVAVAAMAVMLVPAFYAPWQISYLQNKAYNLHNAKRLDEALVLYNTILERNPADSFAIGNKKVIVDYKVYYLEDSALKAATAGENKKACSFYRQMLALDPGNIRAGQWQQFLRDSSADLSRAPIKSPGN